MKALKLYLLTLILNLYQKFIKTHIIISNLISK